MHPSPECERVQPFSQEGDGLPHSSTESDKQAQPEVESPSQRIWPEVQPVIFVQRAFSVAPERRLLLLPSVLFQACPYNAMWDHFKEDTMHSTCRAVNTQHHYGMQWALHKLMEDTLTTAADGHTRYRSQW